jgi:transcriptional regulator with XRE-family HTH domain
MSTLADRIKERMKAMGLNNVELARAAKVKPPTSYNWGSGKTKAIKGEPLLRAATALGVTPEWLSSGVGKKFPAPVSIFSNSESANRVAEPTATYGWPFKMVPPSTWDLLNDDEKSIIEKTILMSVKNRGHPPNHRAPAKSTAGI